ncbi:MAG: portal protein [Pseudomonadota bacterium]
MALTAEYVCKRYKKLATADQAWWEHHLKDIYDYAMPNRRRAGVEVNPGAKRTTKIVDATAVVATQRGAGKLKRALTPDFEDWFRLVPGPIVQDVNQRERMKRDLQQTSAMALAVFASGGFSLAADEMYQDLMAGTGAMIVLRGDQLEPVRFLAISSEAVVLEEDAFGRLCGWYYPQKSVASRIEKIWPNADIHKDLRKIIKETPDKEIELILHCSRQGDGFRWMVIWKDGEHEMIGEDLRTSPFITPRYYKVPGETRGRGPLTLALAHIKTLNKAVEMQLQAGAFALLGVWMVNDDQLFNPRNNRLKPGGMLKVTKTGGTFGASMERLNIPENFDLSGIIIDELRMQIKEMLFDDPLPAETGAVRSPTEITARLQRLSKDINTAFGRLHREFFIPLVERVLDILQQWSLIPEAIKINNLVTKIQILSPLADTEKLEEIEKTVRFYELMVATVGVEEARVFVETDAWGVWLQERMGVDSRVISLPERREEKRQQMQALRAAAAEAGINPDEVDRAANEAGLNEVPLAA